MALSLLFDSCAFIAIVVSAYKSLPAVSAKNLVSTGVVGTVVKDATIYFILIFTSHVIGTLFCFLFSVSLSFLTIPSGVPHLVLRIVFLFFDRRMGGHQRLDMVGHRRLLREFICRIIHPPCERSVHQTDESTSGETACSFR